MSIQIVKTNANASIAKKNHSGFWVDGELSRGVWAGIVLAFVAILAGIVIAAMGIGKGLANDGTVQLQQTLGDMNKSMYQDYDQKVVAGSMVVSAYNQFSGKPVAIIVKTCKGEFRNYNALVSPFTTTAIHQSGSPFKGLSKDVSSKEFSSTVSYFDETFAGSAVNLVMSSNPTDPSKNVVQYNNVVVAMTKTGGTDYVSTTSKFSSFLIRDGADEVIGIVFVQQGKHTV